MEKILDLFLRQHYLLLEAQEEIRRGRFDHVRTIIAKAVALEDELSNREWNAIGDQYLSRALGSSIDQP